MPLARYSWLPRGCCANVGRVPGYIENVKLSVKERSHLDFAHLEPLKGLNLQHVHGPRCLMRVNPVSAKAKTLLAQTFGILSSFGFDGDGATEWKERERERCLDKIAPRLEIANCS